MSDNFDAYTTGNLVPQGSWGTIGAVLTNPVQVVGGAVPAGKAISLTQTAGSREDVYKELGQAMAAGDKWYAGYTVTVTGPVSAGDYFATFYQLSAGSNFFPSKVGVTTSAGSDFTFYVHQGSGSTSADTNLTKSWPTGFSFGSTHRLVVSYEYSTGAGQLWIDPDLGLGPDGSAKIEVLNAASSLIEADRYAFRQGSNVAGTEVVDDVMVGTTWAEVVPEPASGALLVLGALALLRRRR
jgi:hypothetical protein